MTATQIFVFYSILKVIFIVKLIYYSTIYQKKIEHDHSDRKYFIYVENILFSLGSLEIWSHMKLIMILKQTLNSKLHGTHWVPYAPISYQLCLGKWWTSPLDMIGLKVGQDC